MCEKCSGGFERLKGKNVVVGVNASISIYRIPDVIRDLVREGASVTVGMSEEARSFISRDIFHWASEKGVVTEITGAVEHISLFQDPGSTVLLIAPATYNSIGKIASGISDTIPTLMFAYAFGHRVPVIMAPAMHEDMLRNPVMIENIKKLQKLGVEFISPRIEDDKAKIPENLIMVDEVYRALYSAPLRGKRVLIISGRSEEPVDPVRTISNHSSGLTGYWLARNSYRLGADLVTLIGNSVEIMPPYVNHIEAVTAESFYSETKRELSSDSYDVVILPAALQDFSVKESKTKLSGSEEHTLHLKPREKLLAMVRELHNGSIVSFKLDHSLTAHAKLRDSPELMVFNEIGKGRGTFGKVPPIYTVLGRGEEVTISADSKEDASWRLMMHIIYSGSNVRK